MTCTIENCDRAIKARGLCDMHYQRWWRTNGFELKDRHEGDKRAIAYYTGVIDARHRRPCRVPPTDSSLIARLYRRGYSDQLLTQMAAAA